MNAEQVFIVEKFAPCPRCRCFSLEIVKSGKQRKKEISGRIWFSCDNCGYRFSARIAKIDDTLKTISIRDRTYIIKNITFAALAAATLIFIAIKLPIWKGAPAVKPASAQKLEANVDKTGAEKSKSTAKSIKRKRTKRPATKQQSKPEQIPLSSVVPEKSNNIVEMKQKPVKEKSLSMEITPQRAATKSRATTQEKTIPSSSNKVFDLSYMKVRRTYPTSSDPSHRWFFKKQVITIKRSSEQLVFIAGDDRGRRSWTVDDEIRINGQRIKGFSEEITEIGVIPHSVKVPPHDITALVPAGVEVTLDIRLVDYGIFWGNTAIYIVVK